MPLVLAIKARERNGYVFRLRRGDVCGRAGRDGGEVGAGGRAGLVRAIGAVAVVVVDEGKGDVDCGVGYARECICRFIKLGNYSQVSNRSIEYPRSCTTKLKRYEECELWNWVFYVHSGPTPRGLGTSAARTEAMANLRKVNAFSGLMLRCTRH